MDTTINDGTESDINDLLYMNEKLHERHYASAPDIFKPFNRVDVENWFKTGLKNIKCKILIAKLHGKSIGYSFTVIQERKENIFCLARKIIEIDHMYVDKTYRNMGVGKKLFMEIEKFAKINLIQDIELTTWCFNESAQMAFEKMGFTERFKRYKISLNCAQQGDRPEPVSGLNH